MEDCGNELPFVATLKWPYEELQFLIPISITAVQKRVVELLSKTGGSRYDSLQDESTDLCVYSVVPQTDVTLCTSVLVCAAHTAVCVCSGTTPAAGHV